jgi:drug/metabolite transporter (DMT)-like permease
MTAKTVNPTLSQTATGSRIPDIALFTVVVIFASTFVLTKQILAEISPLAFAFVRFGAITILAFAVLAVSVRAGKAQWTIRRDDLPRFAAVGVCGYTLYQLGFVLGIQRTSPFSSSLLIGMVPLFTVAILTLLGERPSLRAWLGISVALSGAIIFLLDKIGVPGTVAGDLLSMMSAIAFATYGVLNRPLVARYPTSTYTAYTLLAGSLPLLAISAPAAAQQDWSAISGTTWLAVAYMIALPVYIAYMVWNWAIGRRGATTASSFTLLVPVVSGMLSVVVFGETFDLAKVVGAAFVLTGLLILQRPITFHRPRVSLSGASLRAQSKDP